MYKTVKKFVAEAKRKKDLKRIVSEIKAEDFVNTWWFGQETFSAYIKVNDEFKNLYKELIDENRSDEFDLDNFHILAEYWLEEKQFHYLLEFEYETVSITDDISCSYLNKVFLDIAQKDSAYPENCTYVSELQEMIAH